jgi:hypothetical protein
MRSRNRADRGALRAGAAADSDRRGRDSRKHEYELEHGFCPTRRWCDIDSDKDWLEVRRGGRSSDRQPPVLVRTDDLRAGNWRPTVLSAPAGTPLYWDGSDVIIAGDQSYRCNTTGHCTRLATPADATIVPRSGLPG